METGEEILGLCEECRLDNFNKSEKSEKFKLLQSLKVTSRRTSASPHECRKTPSDEGDDPGIGRILVEDSSSLSSLHCDCPV